MELKKYSILFKLLLPGAVIMAWYLLPGGAEFWQTGRRFLQIGDLYGLREYLLTYGKIAPLVSILLISLQSVVPFLPGVILTITNAWLFGWIMGSIYSGIGALSGAMLDFYLARWYGRCCFEYLAPASYVQRVNDYIRRRGAMAVLITRLAPIVPFKVVSYSAGCSRMNGQVFMIVTGLGQMPGIVLYSLLGEQLLDNVVALIGITVLLTAMAIFLARWFFFASSLNTKK